MIAALLGQAVLLVRADAGPVDLLLVGGLIAVLCAVAPTVRALGPAGVVAQTGGQRFAELRVLLRASDPAAPGHRRARAPGTTR